MNKAETSSVNDATSSDLRRRTLEAIHDSAVDAIITINERGTIETVNPATEKLFGYSCDELIGKNIKMLMPGPFRGEHDQYLRNYMESGIRKIIGIGRETPVVDEVTLSVGASATPSSRTSIVALV